MSIVIRLLGLLVALGLIGLLWSKIIKSIRRSEVIDPIKQKNEEMEVLKEASGLVNPDKIKEATKAKKQLNKMEEV